MGSHDRRLLRMSRTARRHLLVAIGLGLLTALAVIVQAVELARVVNRVFLEGAALHEVSSDLAVLVGAVVARALFSWGFGVSGHLGAARVMSELRERLVEHVLGSRPGGLDGERSGELAAAAVQGVDSLEAYFSRYLPQLALAALVPVAVLAWVAPLDFVSAGILALTLPLIPVFMVLIGRMAERRTKARWRALTLLSAHFLDVVRGLPTLRAYNRAEAQSATIRAVGDRYRTETMGTLRIAFLSALVLELAAMLGTAMVAVTLGVRLVDGGIGFEAAFTVLLLTPEFYLPLRQLGAQFHASADGLAAAGRIFEVLDTPAAVERHPQPRPMPASRVVPIRFKAVSFAYPARPGKVLDGIDLEVRAGETVALVGPSGAGKSTVASLLMRLVDPSAGSIMVGGRDLLAVGPAEWRAQVAWVPQRPRLFSGTVADNIRLGDPDASDLQVQRAAQAAAACFIDTLADGYDTVVGDGGVPLSAGEAQRVALARAFLRDAPVLILDEPTAHLDIETAEAVGDAVERLAAGRTALLIAHRLELAGRGDRVVVLDQGRIVSVSASAARRAA